MDAKEQGRWWELPPNTSASYLSDAVAYLRKCGNAEDLYGGLQGVLGAARAEAKRYAQVIAGPLARARFGRSAMLFAAFAAEAYVNGYLQAGLPRADWDAVDRLPSIAKFTVATRLVTNSDAAVGRGREPATTLQVLFKTRDALVHPKPHKPFDFASVAPERAARCIVAVSRAAVRLQTLDIAPHALAHDHARIVEFGKRCSAGLPDFEAEPPPDLFVAALTSYYQSQHVEVVRRG